MAMMTNSSKGTGQGRRIFATAAFALLAFLACTGTARAQGSRKDDIVFNAQGRPMAGANVRVCTSGATGQPCSPLALVYSDPAMTQALANPLSADGMGNYTFYATPGRYEIEISGPGIVTKQLPNVILPSDPSSPTFTTVTTTSGISAFSLSLTGNLTVSGSTAVAGQLTVGGAPVASTGVDNQWTATQRFKGPIPYRDFTAYMPAGGCSSALSSDPPATGTISNGSNTLTVSSAADFKTGCGVAVIGAGPMASVTMAGTFAGSAARCANPPSCSTVSGTQVMFTVGSGSLGLLQGSQFAGGNFGGVITISGCSDSNLNTTTTGWITSYNSPVTQFTYVTPGSSGTTATGCTATLYAGWPHGITGATTYNYKVAPVDSSGGLGPAIGPITITTGNATLSPHNFNFISYQATPGARMFAIYSDKGLGGAYSCINMAYGTGYADYGLYLPNGCPPYVPSTPPTSATAETLNTTITAGGGTTTLTLAAAASSNATTQNVYDDVSMFLASCINDVQADQVNTPSFKIQGGAGCLVPFGRWPIAADMPTDTIDAYAGGGVKISVEGTLYFQTWPWFVGRMYTIQGNGQSGGQLNGLSFPTVAIDQTNHMPAGMIVRGYNVDVEGFDFYNMLGDAFMSAIDPSTEAYASNLTVKRFAGSVASNGVGVPLRIDGNALFESFTDINLVPRGDGFPAALLFDSTSYGSNTWCCMSITNLYTQYHGIYFQQPGGSNAGVGASLQVNRWESEDHGTYATCGMICWDSGYTGQIPISSSGNQQGPNIPALFINGIDNADSGNKIGIQLLGTAIPNSAGTITLTGDVFNPLVHCDTSSTRCPNQILVNSSSTQFVGEANSYNGPSSGGGSQQASPLWLYPTSATQNIFSMMVPPPDNLVLTGGSSGSLADGHYCIRMVGLDNQATPGLTLPSFEKCATLSTGGAGSIAVAWQMRGGTAHNQASNWRMYYCFNASADCNYAEDHYQLTNAALNTYPAYSYSFTTTSGAAAATPPLAPTAQYSWISSVANQASCLLCDNHGYAGVLNALGIGDPNPPANAKVSIKGGTIVEQGGTVTPNVNNILYVDGVKYTTIAGAMAALGAGGGEVIVPPGTYNLAATLAITQSNVKLLCAGGSVSYNGSQGACYLKWTGGSGGTVVSFDTPNTLAVVGETFDGFEIDCQSTAGVGLHVYSVKNSLFQNLSVYNCTQNDIDLGANASAIAADGTADNVFQNINSFTSTSAANAWRLTGTSSNDVYLNTFIGIGGTGGATGDGFHVENADNNTFVNLTVAGSKGLHLTCMATATSIAMCARENKAAGVNGSNANAIVQDGANGQLANGNEVTGISLCNGASPPVISSGTQMTYSLMDCGGVNTITASPAFELTEQTLHSGVGGTGQDACQGNSSTHTIDCKMNGGTYTTLAQITENLSLRQKQFIADQGSVCTNGELALSGGWQSTGSASVSGVVGTGQTCEWTITTGTTTAANPTVTDTLTNPLPSANTVCFMFITGGNRTAAASDSFDQTTLSATAPVFTFQGTPTAGGKTYKVVRTCGP